MIDINNETNSSPLGSCMRIMKHHGNASPPPPPPPAAAA